MAALVLCMTPEDDQILQYCPMCDVTYNAPHANYSCPLCGSELVTPAEDQDIDHYQINEDARQALLKTLLTANYFDA